VTSTLETTNGSPRTGDDAGAVTRIESAVAAAQEVHTLHVVLPWIGHVPLPSADELAFVAGIGALAVVGAIEWPVAAVLGAGRLLAHAHRWRSLAAFGDALEHA
jgi:hypothetical protein